MGQKEEKKEKEKEEKEEKKFLHEDRRAGTPSKVVQEVLADLKCCYVKMCIAP